MGAGLAGQCGQAVLTTVQECPPEQEAVQIHHQQVAGQTVRDTTGRRNTVSTPASVASEYLPSQQGSLQEANYNTTSVVSIGQWASEHRVSVHFLLIGIHKTGDLVVQLLFRRQTIPTFVLVVVWL